jgi:hypothetical protein
VKNAKVNNKRKLGALGVFAVNKSDKPLRREDRKGNNKKTWRLCGE